LRVIMIHRREMFRFELLRLHPSLLQLEIKRACQSKLQLLHCWR
jgi:hypothetical protein